MSATPIDSGDHADYAEEIRTDGYDPAPARASKRIRRMGWSPDGIIEEPIEAAIVALVGGADPTDVQRAEAAEIVRLLQRAAQLDKDQDVLIRHESWGAAEKVNRQYCATHDQIMHIAARVLGITYEAYSSRMLRDAAYRASLHPSAPGYRAATL